LLILTSFLLAVVLSACDPNPIVPSTPAPGLSAENPLLVVSEYPRHYAWLEFWPNWPQARDEMAKDLVAIQALGANTVRIFLQPSAFNYPQLPTAEQLRDFDDALQLIDDHGLRAHVALFDCWWSWHELAASRAWLAAIVEPHQNDPRIALWELQNEVDLAQQPVRDWVQAIFPDLEKLAGDTPCTVSVRDVEWLNDVRELTEPHPPEIYALHWYPSSLLSWTAPFPPDLDRARELIGQADLLLVEFGFSTYVVSEASQADLYQDLLYHARQKGIVHLGVWTLYDFPEGTKQCSPEPAASSELYYGLNRLDGSAKPAAALVRDAFAGRFPAQPSPWALSNPSFENRNPNSDQVDDWWSWDAEWSGATRFVQDCTVAHSGNCSARVQGDPATTVGLLHFLGLPVEAGRRYDLAGYVRAENLDGQAWLALSWFDEGEGWLNSDTRSELLTNANVSEWMPLGVEGVEPPPGAAYLHVYAQVYSANPEARVWFDDITVQQR
jgi:hypothetical protein